MFSQLVSQSSGPSLFVHDPPVVVSIDPSSGPQQGGTSVIVTVRNMVIRRGEVYCRFDSTTDLLGVIAHVSPCESRALAHAVCQSASVR